MIGTCCVVLHTHLPWLAHAGAWPVGEEWLHQAWATSYDPVTEVLERLAGDGRTDVLTLGVTPVVAAMLDDPYLLRQHHTWLGTWQVRAASLAARPGADAALKETAAYEWRLASHALDRFERRWRHGGAPVLRALRDSGVVELLGGPATHPFQPLLADERLVRAQLRTGLDDAAIRLGARPEGIWAPECGYAPGLERHYAAAGVTHFVADGPTLLGSGVDTTAPRRVGDGDVVVFGRDLDVTYRVWSPRSGYPGGRWYRDFHTFDHGSGLRPARVTSTRTPPEEKRPYDPARAALAVERDAEDFVRVVVERLTAIGRERGRPGMTVVAYDTELFGHWWHEGPAWLERVLRLLPEAGVRLTTLREARADAERSVDLQPGSWGSGKDWHVWEVPDLLGESHDVQRRLLKAVDGRDPRGGRDAALDQLAREAFLVMSSDWAFCVSKDTAAEYARGRHAAHVARFHELAQAVEAGRGAAVAERLRAVDGPFGHLDARAF
ncbi:MAG TPA: 1,4-alpha-glucan branching protein domain-containing protein [Mycobacteriales bacterium]|jgi:1,4-alpha-glucan branching enzyme|nr:1,4-alpha-glucan branching protein domain-containing protein [Mycobacteriales bacterium]